MKRIGAAFLLVVITLQLSGTGLCIMGFYLNKSFIATVLCVQKDIPGNHCEGKCQLKKQIKKESERESQIPVSNLKSVIDWQINEEDLTDFPDYPTESETDFLDLGQQLIPGYPSAVFHPPSC